MAYPSKGSKREKVRKYLEKKYVSKGIPLDTLNKKDVARQLMKSMPDLWTSLDAARHTVRDVMGCSGPKTRQGISHPEKVKYFARREKNNPTVVCGVV
jgi:hypothetical protein